MTSQLSRAQIHAAEELLAGALSTLPLEVILTSKPQRFNPLAGWIALHDTRGEQILYTIDGMSTAQAVVSCAKTLASSKSALAIGLPTTARLPIRQYGYAARTTDGATVHGTVAWCEPLSQSTLEKAHPLRVQLFLYCAELRRGARNIVTPLRGEIAHGATRFAWHGSLADQTIVIRMESTMSSEDTIPVRIALGNLLIPAVELLRPGSELRFQLPPELEVIVELQGGEVGRGVLRLTSTGAASIEIISGILEDPTKLSARFSEHPSEAVGVQA